MHPTDADPEGGAASSVSGEAAVPYGALFDALGRTLSSERAVLLLYALLHGSSHFHEYCLVGGPWGGDPNGEGGPRILVRGPAKRGSCNGVQARCNRGIASSPRRPYAARRVRACSCCCRWAV